MNRVNFITLGVRDLSKSKAFFNELFGWKPTKKDSDDVAFYDMGGWALALFPWEELAKDAHVPARGEGFRGVAIAHNVHEKHQVAEVLTRAERSGAKIIKPAQDVFWGGHSGYFQDLDGHLWEVAWNPFMPNNPDGTLKIESETY